MALEECTKSWYAYCLGYQGLGRVKILDKHDKRESEYERVLNFDLDLLPTDMQLCSHGHIVYMVGAKDDRAVLYAFDPASSVEEDFPIKNAEFLYKPMKLHHKFEPLVSPMVIKCDGQIYFITQYVNPWFGKSVDNICFQSFDPTRKRFRTLPSPSYTPGTTRYITNGGLQLPKRDDVDTTSRVVAHFAAFDHIYLFIQERLKLDPQDQFLFMRAFSFNTIKNKWKERESMVLQFREKRIRIPVLHRGDTGASTAFPDGTRILVALCNTIPTAYHVSLDKDGSLNPISFRYLEEIQSENSDAIVQLHDMGCGRFCVINESFNIPLMVYVFKIDYDTEHIIQTSPNVSSSSTSSEMLWSRKFLHDNPEVQYPTFYAYCLASAPAFQSSGAAAEEEGRSKKMDKATPERKRKMDEATRERKRNGEGSRGKDKPALLLSSS